MSNSIIPSFLPPPYDFTTEEDEEIEEEDEEIEEEFDKESLVIGVFYGVVLALALHGLMSLEVSVEFKFSVSKSKKNKS